MNAANTGVFQPGRTSLNWQPLQDPLLFERLCAFIFAKKWGDPNISFVGHPGKGQVGLDLYGLDSWNHKRTGVQCKNYTKKFTRTHVDKIIKRIDDEGNAFGIEHLIIAIPLPGSAECQAYVAALSARRATLGQFTVSLSNVADIDHERNLVDAREISRRFPELHYGQDESWLQTKFPDHAAYAEIMEIGRGATVVDGRYDPYDEFITKDFFGEEYREQARNVAIPIDGVNSRRFWLEAYCKSPSGYFSNCNRSVQFEGFFLRCGDIESLHRINELLSGPGERSYSSERRDNFLISTGIMESTVLRLRKALRAAGAIRMFTPTALMSDRMREFLLNSGFVEARSGQVLADAP